MVKKEDLSKALEKLRKGSKKRKFNQAVDLVINFKNIDLKKNPIDQFIVLSHEFSKKIKVAAVVDDDFIKKNEETVDKVISKSELEKLKDNKVIKKLGREFDFFVSQANLMGLVATKVGRILGPLGKMPNPKFGGVVAPGADLTPVVAKFRKSIRISCKNEPIVKTKIAYEDMKDEEIIANITHVYDTITHALPQGDHNVKSVILKLTMGKPVVVGEKKVKEEKKKK